MRTEIRKVSTYPTEPIVSKDQGLSKPTKRVCNAKDVNGILGHVSGEEGLDKHCTTINCKTMRTHTFRGVNAQFSA